METGNLIVSSLRRLRLIHPLIKRVIPLHARMLISILFPLISGLMGLIFFIDEPRQHDIISLQQLQAGRVGSKKLRKEVILLS